MPHARTMMALLGLLLGVAALFGPGCTDITTLDKRTPQEEEPPPNLGETFDEDYLEKEEETRQAERPDEYLDEEAESCLPDCEGRMCGPDGCGGSCGECQGSDICDPYSATCFACVPFCEGVDCGPDGCGGSCGSCEEGDTCTEWGECLACEPQCAGKSCGSDGCGGTCGTCEDGKECALGVCVAGPLECAPVNVPNGVCKGDDPCVCLGCHEFNECNTGDDCVCPECATEPICNQCEDDGVCSPFNESCRCQDCVNHPMCTGEACVPQCDGKSCGGDGCGGSCGTCEDGLACSAAGTCVSDQIMCSNDDFGADACPEDASSCQCFGCNDNGICDAEEDCVCGDCQLDFVCADPFLCIDDGVCNPFSEGCLCADCLAHPACSAAETPACVPNCEGRTCGPDGCEGSCGECEEGSACTEAGACDPLVTEGNSCNNPEVITAPGTFSSEALSLSAEHTGSCGGNGLEGVYQWTAPANGPVCFSTQGSIVDTLLYIRSASCADGEEISCLDDADLDTGELHSTIELEATEGSTYYIFVDQVEAEADPAFQMTFTQAPCPQG